MRLLWKSNKHGLIVKKKGRTVYLYRSKDLTYCIQSGGLDSEGSMVLFKYEYNKIVHERNRLKKPPVCDEEPDYYLIDYIRDSQRDSQ